MDLCSEFFLFHEHVQTQTKAYKECAILEICCVSSDDFVLLKLKKEAAEDAAFLVRWSALDYHRIILAVLNKSEVSQRPRCALGIIAAR